MVKSQKIRICTGCFKAIGFGEKHSSYGTRGGTYYFCHECFQSLLDERRQIVRSKIMHMVLEFGRKGYKSTILKTDLSKYPKAHVLSFEPAEHKKLDDLGMIVECLQHYGKPLSRRAISDETKIIINTVTFRIWENLEGKSESPLFYIDAKKGFRGVELVGLIE